MHIRDIPASGDAGRAPAAAQAPADKRKQSKRSTTDQDQHIGFKIKVRRLELALSQDKLAYQLGLTFQQVQKYEAGSNRVSASRLLQIAKILDVPIMYFFDGTTSDNTFVDDEEAMLQRSTELAKLSAIYLQLAPNMRAKLLDVARTLAA